MRVRRLEITPYSVRKGVVVKVELIGEEEIEMVRQASRMLMEGIVDVDFETWFRKEILPWIPEALQADVLEAVYWEEDGWLVIDVGW